MMFFKPTVALSALFVLVSSMTLERNVPIEDKTSTSVEALADSAYAASFSVFNSACDKEDEADCKEFCGISDQSGTCTASGNKVTCSCKGGKSAPSKCEERCLFCAPEGSSLVEASRLYMLSEEL